MKFSLPAHVARYSLFRPMIEDEIECETINTSIFTSSKPSDFFRADCSYVVAFNFFSSSELVKFFTMLHQVTPSIFLVNVWSYFLIFVIFLLVLVMLYRQRYLMYVLLKNSYISLFYLQEFYLASLLHCICLKCTMRLINR